MGKKIKKRFQKLYKKMSPKVFWPTIVGLFLIAAGLIYWFGIMPSLDQGSSDTALPQKKKSEEVETDSQETTTDKDSATTQDSNFDYKGEESNPEQVSDTPSPEEQHDPYYYYRLGYKQRNAGDYQDAIKSFDKAIELKADDPQFYSAKGQTYAMLKDYQKALETVETGLEAVPGDDTLESDKEIYQYVIENS